ncbi:MAG: aldehyde ferredoxin oxidoreductase N-terminal domain-containing protein [Thermodesulfobacteriota bacterium]
MEKIIRVDMTEKRFTTEKTSSDYQLLGGRGLSARILDNEVPGFVHPLSSENKLIIAPGLLAGTMAPSFGRISCGAKSPLTNTIKESNAGGTAAQKLDRLGVKAIIIQGKPKDHQPHVLVISPEEIKLFPAPELAGKTNYELVRRLRETYGKHTGVISIGPAGEAKMAASTIAVTDRDGRPARQAGRGGLGAVMGSKGIKAIVLRAEGTKPPDVKDKNAFRAAVKELVEILKQDKGSQSYSQWGTPGAIKFLSRLGSMPSWNYHGGVVEGIEHIYGEQIAQINRSRGGRMHGCMPGCVVQCSVVFHGDDGTHLTSALEYETLAMLGTNLAITNLDAIARMDRRCDELGVDTIETGSAIAQAMEAGAIQFGDEQRVLEVLQEIGEGGFLGKVVGQGAAFTARYFGLDRVPTVKGQGIPAHDPRACKAVGVTYSVSPMGADHTAGIDYRNSLSPEGKATTSKEKQILMATTDTVGYCFLALPTDWRVIYEMFMKLLNARYGTDLKQQDVKNMGICALRDEFAFNRSAGWTEAQNRLPEFMRTEELPPNNVVFDIAQEEIDGIYKELALSITDG